MARYKVEISGINTNDLNVLDNEKMIFLFNELKNGNEVAREMLVNGNLKLVLSILRKVNNKIDNLDDLFQIGCIGLLKAIDNFDLSYNVKFSTYAVAMIMGEIRRYIRDNNQMRVSRSVKDLAYKILKLKEEYYLKNGKEMGLDEIEKESYIITFGEDWNWSSDEKKISELFDIIEKGYAEWKGVENV